MGGRERASKKDRTLVNVLLEVFQDLLHLREELLLHQILHGSGVILFVIRGDLILQEVLGIEKVRSISESFSTQQKSPSLPRNH